MASQDTWVKKLLDDANHPKASSEQLFYDIAKNLEPIIDLKKNPSYYVRFISPAEEKMCNRTPNISSVRYLSSDDKSGDRVANDTMKTLMIVINPYTLHFAEEPTKAESGQKKLRFGIDKNDVGAISNEYYNNYLSQIANWLKKNKVNEFEIHALLKEPAYINGQKPPSDMPYSCSLAIKVPGNDKHSIETLEYLRNGINAKQKEISTESAPSPRSRQ